MKVCNSLGYFKLDDVFKASGTYPCLKMEVVICVYQDEKGRCMCAQSCLTFATSWTVAHHGISQARVLE